MFISNHITPMDVVIHWVMMTPSAGFLGKRESLKIPGGKFLIGPF